MDTPYLNLVDRLYAKYIIQKRIPLPSSIENKRRSWTVAKSIKNDVKSLYKKYRNDTKIDARVNILKKEMLELYLDASLNVMNENHNERCDYYVFLTQ